MSKFNYGKRSYKLSKVNKDFISWIRSEPRYRGNSDNDATKKLHDDIVTGQFTNTELRQRATVVINALEDMIYGKRKKR